MDRLHDKDQPDERDKITSDGNEADFKYVRLNARTRASDVTH
jgi:hypothetical protein